MNQTSSPESAVLVPAIPETAPFTPEQRAWFNGYLAGLFCRAPAQAAAPAPKSLAPLTILWGSQTGSSESLAKKAAKGADQHGFAATVRDMAEVTPAELAQIGYLLVITSTYGDGEPPDNAKGLYDALRAADAPPLPSSLRYSVCALGDTNYEKFCQCGIDLDETFERLGATRVAPRADCDVDYDVPHASWLRAAFKALASEAGPAAPAPAPTASSEPAEVSTSIHSRAHPFLATLLTVRKLSADSSAKEVNHVEFSLEDSGLLYEAGDALGVYPQNCPDAVSALLAALGCDGEEGVPAPDGAIVPMRRALTEFYDIGKPTPGLVGAIGESANGAFHVIDALATAGGLALKPEAFVTTLKRLQPRLYSISSSPKAHPGQVHLTVGAVRYDVNGRSRKGVCSTFLPERGSAVAKVPVFVHANTAFRLPADGSTPMIMVGPGTGIAPFRAFLEERRETGASGPNWLLFGDQRKSTDFLYRAQLEGMKSDGILTRLDLAWSRDQTAKVYVQHRMLEAAAEFWKWLEQGAHFYVCGDATRMAKDVDAALHQIVETSGGMTAAEASQYVQKMRAGERYQRDVY